MSAAHERIRRTCEIIFDPTHLRRTLLVTLIVGLALSFANDGGQILSGAWRGTLVMKVAMDFCTPFVVANLGLLAHHSDHERPQRR